MFDGLHAAVPGQNLDQRIRSKSAVILHYIFDTRSESDSGSAIVKSPTTQEMGAMVQFRAVELPTVRSTSMTGATSRHRRAARGATTLCRFE